MKRILSVSLVMILLLSGLFVFTGCEKEESKKKDDKKTDLSTVAGTYRGQYTKLVGDTEKNEDEEFSLELKEDGTGLHNRNDSSYRLTWSLDGDKFKMTEKFLGSSIEYTGTLKDDKLDIFNGDPDDMWTYEYVYKKSNGNTVKDKKNDINKKYTINDDEDDDYNTTTKTTTKTESKTDTKKDNSLSTTTTTNKSEIRAEFKEAMDSYESFIDDYVTIMKKYKASNGTDTSILTDYSTYMSKYNELSQKFQKWSSESLNDAEMSYYTEVLSRVSKKIQNAY